MTVDLRAHGTHVNANFSDLPLDPTGMGQLTSSVIESRGDSWGVMRYEKRISASPTPQALGWIKNIHSDAIEYTGMTKEMRGLAFLYGIVLSLPMALGIGGSGLYVVILTRDFETFSQGFVFYAGIGMAAFGIGFGVYIFCMLVRNDLFMPQDLPVIFDRKHRKVYRLLQDHPGDLRPRCRCSFWDVCATVVHSIVDWCDWIRNPSDVKREDSVAGVGSEYVF